jgi:hypothetical protein
MPEYNFTISEELYQEMKKHLEIKWNELFRKTIKDYLNKLNFIEVIKSTELLDKL